jgi:predicted nucleotide-binding protein
VRPIREQAQLFIGSSREGLPLTDEIAHGLLRDPVLVRRWTNNVFVASHYPLEDLETSLAAADLALLIATPDDVIASRGSSHNAPRDNIVFELGLFMGALGRRRSFLLRPRGVDLKLPTDLLGLTPIDYDADTTRPLDARMTPVCHELRRLIATLGPI